MDTTSRPSGAGVFETTDRSGLPTDPSNQACCCVARAVVRVVMPPTADRPHETELLLCGHHYRVSRAALAAAHTTVFELPGSSGIWFHDDPGQPAPALVAAT